MPPSSRWRTSLGPWRWALAELAIVVAAAQERFWPAALELARVRENELRGSCTTLQGQRMRVRVDAYTLERVAVELTIEFRYHPSLHRAVLLEHASDALLHLDELRGRSVDSITQTVQACVRVIRYDDLRGRRVQIVGALAHELARVLQRLSYVFFDAKVSEIRSASASYTAPNLAESSSQVRADPTESKIERTALSRWESEGGRSDLPSDASSTRSTPGFR